MRDETAVQQDLFDADSTPPEDVCENCGIRPVEHYGNDPYLEDMWAEVCYVEWCGECYDNAVMEI